MEIRCFRIFGIISAAAQSHRFIYIRNLVWIFCPGLRHVCLAPCPPLSLLLPIFAQRQHRFRLDHRTQENKIISLLVEFRRHENAISEQYRFVLFRAQWLLCVVRDARTFGAVNHKWMSAATNRNRHMCGQRIPVPAPNKNSARESEPHMDRWGMLMHEPDWAA